MTTSCPPCEDSPFLVERVPEGVAGHFDQHVQYCSCVDQTMHTVPRVTEHAVPFRDQADLIDFNCSPEYLAYYHARGLTPRRAVPDPDSRIKENERLWAENEELLVELETLKRQASRYRQKLTHRPAPAASPQHQQKDSPVGVTTDRDSR